MRLDRLISNHPEYSHRAARQLIACGRVQVNGEILRDTQAVVDRFAAVSIDSIPLRSGYPSLYLMLHKPVGYLSATTDPAHPTVLDLIDPALHERLHIGGRLDRNSSGLLLLTNDGLWSRRLTEPGVKIPKVYRVTTAEPIAAAAEERFAKGIYFGFENITTTPAELQRTGECSAMVTIFEGRYHQIKRMFHAVGNRVVTLHRERMGEIALDPSLLAGDYRRLTQAEVDWL